MHQFTLNILLNSTNYWQKIVDKMSSWLDSAITMLPNLVLALLVMIVAFFAAKFLRNAIKKLIAKVTDNSAITSLLGTIATVVILIIGLFVALSILELDKALTSLLAGAGVAGLALGLAFQEPIINTVSGVIIAMRKSYRIGDLVSSNDYFGIVEEITLRDTTIASLSGEKVIIPNKLIVQNPFVNYSISQQRRVELSCGVSYSDDLQKVKEVAKNALQQLDVIDKEKGVDIVFTEFDSSSINFKALYWLKTEHQFSYLEAKSEGIMQLKRAFDANNISIPFPIRTLDFADQKLSIETSS